MSNWFKSLASAIAALPSGAASSAASVGSTISSWFSTKYSAITQTLQDLQNAGPGANPAQLNGLLSQLSLQFAQVHGLPGAEFSFETTLMGLVGKTDAMSVNLWSSTCAAALSTLQNASSAL